MTRSEGKRCHPKTMISRKADPPTDDGGLGDFYNNWTNSILQQMKRPSKLFKFPGSSSSG
jgi:hypothetical protein